jgi:hypothetical protein
MEKRLSKAQRLGIGQARFAQADARAKEVMDFHRRRQEAEEAKMQHLKSLRLAKEAADREEVARKVSLAAAQSPPRSHRKKKVEPLPSV